MNTPPIISAWAPRLLAAGLLCAVVVVTPFASAATAQTDTLDVRIDRDLTPRTLVAADLSVNLVVTITEHQTGSPPADRFEVVAFATNGQAEKTITYPCGQIRDNDPHTAPGVYACTVIVDHGGLWTFQVVINRPRIDKRQAPITLAQAKADYDIRGGTLGNARNPTAKRVKGRFGEVVILWAHSAAAALWLACLAFVALLVHPGARRRLSTTGLRRFEDRLDVVLKSLWTATVLTIGSGVYLMLKQTAYKTPFSSSAVRGVFALPYGKPYFLSLATKLGLYASMLVAAVVLAREARRQLRLGFDPSATPAPGGRRARPAEISPWDDPDRLRAGSGAGQTLVKTRPETDVAVAEAALEIERRAPLGVRLATVVIGFGGVGIWICVTLLKYFHELVEAARL